MNTKPTVRIVSIVFAALAISACGSGDTGAVGGSAATPNGGQPTEVAATNAGSGAPPSSTAAEAAGGAIDKAGAKTGSAIQTADRAMNKALTDPTLGDKAASGVNKLAGKLSNVLGAADRRARNAAVKAGLPTQRGLVRSRDAGSLALEFKVGEQTQTVRYIVTPDTTVVDDVKVGQECTVTFMRDGDRHIAVSFQRFVPEEQE